MHRTSETSKQQNSTCTLRELQAQFARAKLPFPDLEPEDIHIPKRKQGLEITKLLTTFTSHTTFPHFKGSSFRNMKLRLSSALAATTKIPKQRT
jgi:hypothetical protein